MQKQQEQLQKDLDEICRLTNSRWGKYADLSQYDENGRPVKMKEFLAEMKDFLGKNYKVYLLDSNIITRIPGGGYDFVFNSDIRSCGGQTHFDLGEKQDQSYFVFFDDGNDYESETGYHEAGHVFQYKYNYFDDNKLDAVYRFCSKGLSKADKQKHLVQEFVDCISYKRYLNEMHSEMFANACQILHFENEKDFKRRCRKAMSYAAAESLNAFKDEETEYPSSKYYYTFPLQKALVQRLKEEYYSDEIDKYYIEKGHINFKFLADEMESFVLKNALTPRTFLQLLRNDRKGESYAFENRWQHQIPEMRVWKNVFKFYKKEIKDSSRKSVKLYQAWQKVSFPKYEILPEVDEDIRLLNVVCRVSDAYVRLDYALQHIELYADKYPELDPCLAVRHGSLPLAALDSAFAKMSEICPDDKSYIFKLLEKYKMSMNQIDFRRVDKDVACEIIEKMRSPSGHEKIWELYRQKSEAPWQDINLAAYGQSEEDYFEEPSTSQLFYRLKRRLRSLKRPDGNAEAENLLRCDVGKAILRNPEDLTSFEWRLELGKKHIPAKNKQNREFVDNFTDNVRKNLNKIYLLYYENPDQFLQMLAEHGHYLLPTVAMPRKEYHER